MLQPRGFQNLQGIFCGHLDGIVAKDGGNPDQVYRFIVPGQHDRKGVVTTGVAI
jgi:hypothetical protein